MLKLLDKVAEIVAVALHEIGVSRHLRLPLSLICLPHNSSILLKSIGCLNTPSAAFQRRDKKSRPLFDPSADEKRLIRDGGGVAMFTEACSTILLISCALKRCGA